MRQDAAILDGVSSIGTGTVPSRLWYQPSITVTGIDAPTVANASNTLIPEVSVRVSARIAPGQKAEDAFKRQAHLNENRPFGAQIAITEVADMGAVRRPIRMGNCRMQGGHAGRMGPGTGGDRSRRLNSLHLRPRRSFPGRPGARYRS
ncbi:MAG: peptidase dimerization domain-containing protein [Cryobacterium sp.]|nr:peptidase dimerization domain-containing protein [Cryobacterium sp.]